MMQPTFSVTNSADDLEMSCNRQLTEGAIKNQAKLSEPKKGARMQMLDPLGLVMNESHFKCLSLVWSALACGQIDYLKLHSYS